MKVEEAEGGRRRQRRERNSRTEPKSFVCTLLPLGEKSNLSSFASAMKRHIQLVVSNIILEVSGTVFASCLWLYYRFIA